MDQYSGDMLVIPSYGVKEFIKINIYVLKILPYLRALDSTSSNKGRNYQPRKGTNREKI